MINIGDKLKYNGNIHNKCIFHYEKQFIKNNMTIGELYKILNINDTCYGFPWYEVKCDNAQRYWIPSIFFDVDIKEKYNLI